MAIQRTPDLPCHHRHLDVSRIVGKGPARDACTGAPDYRRRAGHSRRPAGLRDFLKSTEFSGPVPAFLYAEKPRASGVAARNEHRMTGENAASAASWRRSLQTRNRAAGAPDLRSLPDNAISGTIIGLLYLSLGDQGKNDSELQGEIVDGQRGRWVSGWMDRPSAGVTVRASHHPARRAPLARLPLLPAVFEKRGGMDP
jgi:hypothetical protein